MLHINSSQIRELEQNNWKTWVRLHVDILTELLPDVAAQYPDDAFGQRIEMLLRRADMHAMVEQRETVPYCYASLTLGVGFEAHPGLPWAATAMALRARDRGEAIWNGLESTPARAGAGA